jgi:hypothetical protein
MVVLLPDIQFVLKALQHASTDKLEWNSYHSTRTNPTLATSQIRKKSSSDSLTPAQWFIHYIEIKPEVISICIYSYINILVLL